jgi:DNA (cytosine-5)-methyltransferase 1
VAQKGGLFVPSAFGGGNRSGPIEVAASLAAHGVRQDFEVETFVCAPPLTSNPYGDHESREGLLVAHSLRREGFDASEDGTGRGTPLVPIAIQERAISENPDAGPDGVGVRQDGAAYTLEARQVPQAVAFAQNSRDEVRLQAEPGMKQTTYVQQGWAVRRLMPVECERLQGFPDGYTDIPYRGKPAADGPRYKALGNSWAVNVARWVGRRIEMVEQISAELQKERAA